MNGIMNFHGLIPRPCFDRPFVCEGFPDSCNVIVVGENPATAVGADWWTFWDDGLGFDLIKFEDAYASARSADGKRATSNTRLRLNRLRHAGSRCLETNLFSNERLNGAGRGASKNVLLPMFLAHLPDLKAVIAHGSVASKRLPTFNVPDGVQKYHLRHFRHESYDRIDSVARKILMH